ncbi:Anaphase-promoting complex subunit 1 [Agyrium rufum]|nr:Anaphase-promoting complex subunit 1 [Agyrium rufum]
MASIKSLGLHTPSALPTLVADGLLPADPPRHLYEWQVFHDPLSDDGGEEEELLYTTTCVVWSVSGIIRRIFRFDIEKEAIAHVTCTRFSSFSEKASPNRNALSNNAKGSAPVEITTTSDAASLNSSHADHDGLRVPLKAADDSVPVPVEERKKDVRGTQSSTLSTGRAIAVALKTQLHLYFLSGTSHVVHLPFEVDKLFALPDGILLQRKALPLSIQAQSPRMLSVPPNSFAFSQPASSWSIPESQTLQNALAKPADQPASEPLRSLFTRIYDEARASRKDHIPKAFILTDPFAEYAAVSIEEQAQPDVSSKTPSLKGLDSSESVVYVSSHDELSSIVALQTTANPLLLVVTINQETNVQTIWYADFPSGRHQSALKGGSDGRSGRQSRRRSSFGAAMLSGTSTPAIRSSTGPREPSLGVKLRKSEVHTQARNEEIAAMLDPAFENPARAAKSSRRVSSLLARSDLASSHADLTVVNSGRRRSRRGQSAGPYGSIEARLSLGPRLGVESFLQRAVSNPPHDLASEMSVSEFGNSMSQAMSEDEVDDSPNHQPPNESNVHGSSYRLIKVHSSPPASLLHEDLTWGSSVEKQLSVFTLKPPVVKGKRDSAELYMCIVDRARRQLSVLSLQIRNHTKGAIPARSKRNKKVVNIRVKDVKIGHNILDACLVSSGGSSQIAVLEKGEDGLEKISLQSPWSYISHLRLPSSFAVSDPFQMTDIKFPCSKGTSGSKRVLHSISQTIIHFAYAAGRDRVSIQDSQGLTHRLSFHMIPENCLVRNLIEICHVVLPYDATLREPILRLWWNVMAWLGPKGVFSDDLEWSAFVISIFSFYGLYLEELRPPTTLAFRKRQGGLSRSSSGADSAMTSWSSLLGHEIVTGGPTVDWLHGAAWDWTNYEGTNDLASPSSRTRTQSKAKSPLKPYNTFLVDCVGMAQEFTASVEGQQAFGHQGFISKYTSMDSEHQRAILPTILIAFHLYREELKLNILTNHELAALTPLLSQLGGWLGWESWGWDHISRYAEETPALEGWLFSEGAITRPLRTLQRLDPPSIFRFIEESALGGPTTHYLSLVDIALSEHTYFNSKSVPSCSQKILPRTTMITQLLHFQSEDITLRLKESEILGLNLGVLETLPEGVAAPIRAAMAAATGTPSTTFTSSLLEAIGRDDITKLQQLTSEQRPLTVSVGHNENYQSAQDVHSICHSTLEIEVLGAYDGSAEFDRQSVTRMIFKHDQRFADAAKLIHPLKDSVARCVPEPDWTDTDLLEAQQELAKVIAKRTLSVSAGRSLLFYSARLPLLTEKFPIHGFTLKCLMKPMNATVTADKNTYTEEKVSWAFFHAGVEAGLSISRKATGIDTSWILFNKPPELSNRHAGFLLALGFNGHLKSIAKWVAFKYLTPKHTMTSIGLLLGLAASYLGTMDTLITRLLSVHVTRMLPPGAAELNLSPLTQTTGIMAIGLLYCNTQHRRMTEIMVSEIENSDQDENESPMETLRDEGYRLAAGFALGYINLGQGHNMKGLHDLYIVERLLSLAIGTRRVDIVHILDKATAAATIAITLIYMKTGDESIARKIDVPDTTQQFEYVRPDIFLLRTVARHLIMWDKITPAQAWIRAQLPSVFRARSSLSTIRTLTSKDLPLLNIIAGLCLSIGLRYAGTGIAVPEVRSLLIHYLDQFIRIVRLPALTYDAKLARISARNCQDVVALAVSTVMAGTGDLHVFRRLRSLHGRTDPDTPYGSHLATHLAMGALFLGGGTHTFGTSNLAIASLLCAFYPLFPSTVQDNKSHLQAFRHFWVLAAEARCLVVRDVDTMKPLSMPILIKLRSSNESLLRASPCLLPELESVASVTTQDADFWPVTLDLARNQGHLAAFKCHQSIFVRRRSAYDKQESVFSKTMQALNDSALVSLQQGLLHSAFQPDGAGTTGFATTRGKDPFDWIFSLPSLSHLDRAERALVLPSDESSSTLLGPALRTSVVDERISLEKGALVSNRAERIWSLRLLFAWVEGLRRRGRESEVEWWLGREVIAALRAGVWMRGVQGATVT